MRFTGCMSRCFFVPPYLLERLGLAERQLVLDTALRSARAAAVPTFLGAPPSVPTPTPGWTVHSAGGTSRLPGDVVRRSGDPESGDPAVDEAASGISGALALFAEVYHRSSYDDAGAPVSLTVHYQHRYANAFWDGAQLVFGDGDGEVFDRFTKSVDVLGHELTHAVTERSAGLVYRDQPGALNESLSDVFASCLKQRLLGQVADEADWLIGAEIFLPGVRARGLRDMAAPGTAYDDPRLGRDPQPAHLDDYVEGPADNGGVHLNSGIPNRAFHLAAVGIGGSSWEGAGRIWYDALVGDRVGPETDFAGFAAATVAAAGARAQVVAEAWSAVGITVPTGSRLVRVQRSGGFAGLVTDGRLDLDADGDDEIAALVETVDLSGVRGGPPRPDMFVYDFDLCGRRAVVPEQQLTDDLRRIAERVLSGPDVCDGPRE